jgi:hypothetical protein
VGYTIINETSARKLGDDIYLDILLDSHPEHFLEQVGYFQNLKNYITYIQESNTFKCLTANGYVYKLRYDAPEPISKSYLVILKINQDA